MSLSFKFDKDPSLPCGNICQMALSIFSQLCTSKVFKDEWLLKDNGILLRLESKCHNIMNKRTHYASAF